ncbi:MAG TPA: glycosyltransferase family 39 protein [Phycisphaerae bacterium]|nr:glycosyltransferase family 39 protein [Phycisphaerae bacterium]
MTTMPTRPEHDPKERRHAILVFAALAILYLLTLNNQWAIEPDSAMYLTLGRSIAEGRGMEYNGAPAWGVPPLLPVLIAGSRLLFGPAYWPINLLISLSALGTVIFAYLAVRRLAPEVGADDVRLALAALLITGTSARLLVDSTRILTDVPCTFFVALGLYAFVRARQDHWAWCWAGLGAMLLATAARLPAGVILVGSFVGVALEFRREGYRRRLLATLAGMGGVAVGVLGWWFLVRGRSIGGPDYFVRISEWFRFDLWERWIQVAEGPFRLPGALCEAITGQELQWFNVVPTALILFGLWTAARRGQWVLVCPVLAYVAFLLGLGGSAVAPRYLLPVMPMLVYALVVGTVELAAWVSRCSAVAVRTARSRRRRTPERTARRRRTVLAVVTVFCVAVSLPKAVREVVRMHRPDFYETYEGGKWKGNVELGQYLASLRESGLAGPTDRVLAPAPAILHYFSGLPTDSQVYWKPTDFRLCFDPPAPPADFVKAFSQGSWRFVVLPTNKGTWSKDAVRAIEATGAFRLPPERFRGLVLYARLPAEGRTVPRAP